jgi:nucleoside-diphosphate-sugar epimerase
MHKVINKMNYLITGGAGFIGSYLVERLLAEDHKVIVIDDFSMGKKENLPKKHPNLIIASNSILDASIEPLFEDIDVVFHLAALTRPRESFNKFSEYNHVNVNGTLNILSKSIMNKVKNFVFISSASAYGFKNKFPFSEIDALEPVSPYALTKLVGEEYCKMFARVTAMKINIVRPFNVFGKRQDPNGPYASAISKFVDTLKTDGKPFITGDGKQFRDFIYVEDVVDLLLKVSKSDYTGEVFNAGSGKHTSVNALYETLQEIMKKKVEPSFIKAIQEPNTLAGTAKVRALLNWTPKYSLIEGLLKTI